MAAIARMARSYDVSPLPVTGFASPAEAPNLAARSPGAA